MEWLDLRYGIVGFKLIKFWKISVKKKWIFDFELFFLIIVYE